MSQPSHSALVRPAKPSHSKASRLTGGTFRGHPIKAPQTATTHPMGARERLALFNALSARLNFQNLTVLDAYAGTGALGMEALSRGAKYAVFVENDHRALAVLRENLRLFEPSRQEVLPISVVKFTSQRLFDLIFIDPPYPHFATSKFLHLAKYLSPGGYIVLSHPKSSTIPFSGYTLVSQKTYASATISTLQFGNFVV